MMKSADQGMRTYMSAPGESKRGGTETNLRPSETLRVASVRARHSQHVLADIGKH